MFWNFVGVYMIILMFKNISFARREISYLRVAKKYALFIYFSFGVFKNNQSVNDNRNDK